MKEKEINEQLCLVEEAAKGAKRIQKENPILYISCPCPKCSPRC